MNTTRRVSPFLPVLGMALLLATSSSNLVAQSEQLKQATIQDTRYYIYVSGITWPTWLTNVVKQLRQVAGVRQVKVVDFKKGLFALTPNKGGKLSESEIRAAVKRSGFTPRRVVVPQRGATGEPPKLGPTSDEKPVPAEIEKLLAGPKDAFRKGDLNAALKGALDAAQKRPKDATVQQFVSLVAFALGKFDDASTAAHAALQSDPHWKWKRLRGHYAKTEVYSLQLRKLENFVRKHAASAESRFLLAYHYLMLGQSQAARSHLKRVAEQKPDDKLVRQLLEPPKKEGSTAPWCREQ